MLLLRLLGIYPSGIYPTHMWISPSEAPAPYWSTSPTDAYKASNQCFSASVLNMNRQPGIIRELRKVSNLTEL